MRQAIIVKYLGPTDYRGSRLKASCEAGSATFPYKSELNIGENHESAARSLLNDLGWDKHNDLVGGWLPNGQSVFVLVDKREV